MGLRRFFRRSAEHSELAREIEAHLAHEIEDNVARGMSEEEARRQAYLKFGNPQRVLEDVWQWNTAEFVENIYRDLFFAVGITVLSGTAAGLMPALGAQGSQILNGLQESSRSHSGGQGRARLRKLLLAIEVGLTVVLLIAAGLLLKSYDRLRSSDLGCSTANILTMRVDLPKPK
jgi:hypothetical protein